MDLTVAYFLYDGRLWDLFRAELPNREPDPDHPSLLRSFEGHMVFRPPGETTLAVDFGWSYFPEARSAWLCTGIWEKELHRKEPSVFAVGPVLSGLQVAHERELIDSLRGHFGEKRGYSGHFDPFGLDTRPMLMLHMPRGSLGPRDGFLHAWTRDVKKGLNSHIAAVLGVVSVLAVRFLRQLHAVTAMEQPG